MMEVFRAMSAAAMSRDSKVQFVFCGELDTNGYVRIQHEGHEKLLHVGDSMMRGRVLNWLHAGKKLQGAECTISWHRNRLEVDIAQVHKPAVTGRSMAQDFVRAKELAKQA